MPELRRSARSATVEATKRSEQPPAKKAKTSAGSKKTEEKKEPVSDGKVAPEADENAENDAKSHELEVGDEIPDLTLLDENEKEVSLSDVAKKSKFLVIFAYPKASTPGCTKQANGFQKNYADLQALGTAVYGLSADTPKSQLNFVTKQGLKYPLLSDPSRKLISVLGAKKSPTGVKRSHWIFVDGKLTIKKIQISPDVSVESALEDVQKLKEDGEKGGEEKEDVGEEKEDVGEEKEEKNENGEENK